MVFFFLISLLLSLLLGKPIINILKSLDAKQFIREDGPSHHVINKSKTPTMGALIFLIPIFLLSFIQLFFIKGFQNKDFIALLIVTFVLALLGFTDDIQKVLKKTNKGVSGWMKLFIQLLLSAYLFFIYKEGSSFFYLIWVFFIIAGSSNSFNLTDGLDGLLGSISIVSFLGFAVLFLFLGKPDLVFFSLISIAALVGFLYYNWHPAKVFMGDTGSLAIGGAIGTLAIISKVELILFFFAIIPILEAISVILQVLFFKFTKRLHGEGKRLFKMAPLHHHFELCGLDELLVVKRFTLVQLIFAILGVFAILNHII